jgi:hypothetical protein
LKLSVFSIKLSSFSFKLRIRRMKRKNINRH